VQYELGQMFHEMFIRKLPGRILFTCGRMHSWDRMA